jgi:outer membrane protein
LAEKAVAQVEAARRIAKLAPVQLQAARAAEQQAAARYRAGLATIVEVADTQRLLTQAEIDAGLANLAIWRSLLALYAARGDVESFVALSGR